MLHEFEPKKDDMNTPKKWVSSQLWILRLPNPVRSRRRRNHFSYNYVIHLWVFFLYFLFYKALILTQLVIKKRKKGRETDPRAGASPFCRASDSRTLSRLPSRPPAREGRRAKKRAGREKEDGAEEEPGGVPPEGDEPTGHKDESQ